MLLIQKSNVLQDSACTFEYKASHQDADIELDMYFGEKQLTHDTNIKTFVNEKHTKQQLKKKFRKEAKLQQRAIRKSEKLVPVIVKGVSQFSNMIEKQLPKQSLKSNFKFFELVNCEVQKEMRNQQGSKNTIKVENLDRKLEHIIMTMICKLDLPHQVLIIAQTYINRICASMAQTQFFLTSAVAESVVISSIVIAAKYYLEATEVVVNCDIARVLYLQPQKLNRMEEALLPLIVDQMYISCHDYNKQACDLNKKIKAIELETRASSMMDQDVEMTQNRGLSKFPKRKANSQENMKKVKQSSEIPKRSSKSLQHQKYYDLSECDLASFFEE